MMDCLSGDRGLLQGPCDAPVVDIVFLHGHSSCAAMWAGVLDGLVHGAAHTLGAQVLCARPLCFLFVSKVGVAVSSLFLRSLLFLLV